MDIKDPIIEKVVNDILSRSSIGIKKYGTTLHENNKDNFLQHLQEELFDGINYIEKLKSQKEDITQIVKNEPNDKELGIKIRRIYGKL